MILHSSLFCMIWRPHDRSHGENPWLPQCQQWLPSSPELVVGGLKCWQFFCPHVRLSTKLCTIKAMLLRFGPCRIWLNCWQVSPKVVKIWNQAMIEKESSDQSSISPPCPDIMRSGGELSGSFLGVSHFIVTVLSLAGGKLWRVEECYEELKKSLLPTLRLFLPGSLGRLELEWREKLFSGIVLQLPTRDTV